MLLNRIGLACSPTSNEPLLFWPKPTTPTATDQTPSCHCPSGPRNCCGSISASKPDQSYDTEGEPNSAVASVHLWLASGSRLVRRPSSLLSQISRVVDHGWVAGW